MPSTRSADAAPRHHVEARDRTFGVGLSALWPTLLGLARLLVSGSDLLLHLNPLEKMAALRGDLRVPLSRVVGVSILDKPLDSSWYRSELKLGIAARGAPAAKIATVIGAPLESGGKAFVAVYRNASAVTVDLSPSDSDPWRRLVVSVGQPAAVAKLIESAGTA